LKRLEKFTTKAESSKLVNYSKRDLHYLKKICPWQSKAADTFKTPDFPKRRTENKEKLKHPHHILIELIKTSDFSPTHNRRVRADQFTLGEYKTRATRSCVLSGSFILSVGAAFDRYICQVPTAIEHSIQSSACAIKIESGAHYRSAENNTHRVNN
jgi:hypothetical protein